MEISEAESQSQEGSGKSAGPITSAGNETSCGALLVERRIYNHLGALLVENAGGGLLIVRSLWVSK